MQDDWLLECRTDLVPSHMSNLSRTQRAAESLCFGVLTSDGRRRHRPSEIGVGRDRRRAGRGQVALAGATSLCSLLSARRSAVSMSCVSRQVPTRRGRGAIRRARTRRSTSDTKCAQSRAQSLSANLAHTQRTQLVRPPRWRGISRKKWQSAWHLPVGGRSIRREGAQTQAGND